MIEVSHLTKAYGAFTAVDDLSFKLAPGEILGFLGPNGAGKTTTIKILVGLMRPTSGSASIAGADCVRDARRIKRLVGFMPDTFGSYDNMRVREYLDFFGAAFGLSRRKRMQRIDEHLADEPVRWRGRPICIEGDQVDVVDPLGFDQLEFLVQGRQELGGG